MVNHWTAEFVAGVQGGIDFRNRLKDRKLDRARQEKMDELTYAREARAAEEHALRMGEARREMGLRDAGIADQQAAWERARAYVDEQPVDVTAGTAGAPPSPEARGVAEALGIPMDPRLELPAPAGLPAAPLPAGAAPAAGAIPTPGPAQAAAARVARPNVASATGPQVPPPPDMPDGRYSYAKKPESKTAGQQIADTMAPVWRAPVAIADDIGGKVAAAGQYPYGLGLQGLGVGAAALGFPETGDMMIDAGRRTVGAAGRNFQYGLTDALGKAPQDPATLETAPLTTTVGPAPQAPTKTAPLQDSPKPPAPSPTVQAAAERGIAAVQEAAPPATQRALQAGAEAATKGMGLTPEKPITKAQRARGEAAALDRYLTHELPRVINRYMARGDIEGAMGMMEFMELYSTKQAMKTYASAMFDASVGNYEGAFRSWAELYNNERYFPDGLTVDMERSRVVYGEDGVPTGMFFVQKDKEGNEFERIIQADDMTAWGATMLAPENAVTFWADAAKAKMEREKGIAEAEGKAAKEATKTITDMATEIFKAKAGLDQNYTMEMAMQEAAQALGLGGVARPGDVPAPLYRP